MNAIDQSRSVDVWLRFDAKTKAQHDAERGSERAKMLSHSIILGLIFYNLYNLTSLLLMPDIFWTSVAMRTAVVTPGSLVLAYLVLVVGPRMREILVLGGVILAFAVPVGLFWTSRSPLSAYTFGELPLTLMFANMLLPLRFRFAVVFSVYACLIAAAAALTKTDMPDGLGLAFCLQIVTAAALTLVANYMSERRRVMDYLLTLGAEDRAFEATQESQALDRLSRLDPLTGLPNRRALDEAVNEAYGQNETMALVMIDVDYFKLYNDTLGHQQGDICLKALSAEFSRIAREKSVMAARLGGEEFVFLLAQTSEFEAARLCQIIVARVQALEIDHPGRRDGASVVTVSVGLALREQGSATPIAEVFRAADVALYKAKRQGRNQFYWPGAAHQKLSNI